MSFAGHRFDNVASGIDEDQRGPSMHAVPLPDLKLAVVHDRMGDLVTPDRVGEGRRVAFVGELRGVNPDDR